MPEGDAVWRTARRLHRALAGGVLLGSDLRVPALALQDLAGRTTLEVVPRGKHLLHRVEGGLTLHSHLRMDGSWRVLPSKRSGEKSLDPGSTAYVRGVVPSHPAARHHTVRAVLWTADLLAIGDRLGMLDLVETVHEDRLVGHLGPDLLDRSFDRELALANLVREPRTAIAEALLDQRNLAGIGTIYASEPLFEHRVNPWLPVGQVGHDVLAAVVDTARLWMVRSCKVSVSAQRASSTPVPADGWLPRRYRVFGREGRPCRRCGTPIRQSTVGAPPRAREFRYCPVCQGG